MSRKLARPLSKAASPLRAALLELDAAVNKMLEGGIDTPAKRLLVYTRRVARAAGKVRRRADIVLGVIPEEAKSLRKEAGDAFICAAATEVAGNDRDPVTVAQIEKWLDENHPDGVRDPATIRAALKRRHRLKRNPRGRPRKPH